MGREADVVALNPGLRKLEEGISGREARTRPAGGANSRLTARFDRRGAAEARTPPVHGRGGGLVGTWIPPFLCALLPLFQVGGFVYLHDVAVVVVILGLLRARPRYDASRWQAVAGVRVWLVAVVVGLVSSVGRVGLQYHPVAFSIQLGLYGLYGLLLYAYVSTRQGHGLLQVKWLSVAAGLLAASGIALHALYLAAPGVAANIYTRFLDLCNYPGAAYVEMHVRRAADPSSFRAFGPWLISTSFGGITVLLAAVSLLLPRGSRAPLLLGAIAGVAALLSQTRHAWVAWLVLFAGALQHQRGGRLSERTRNSAILGTIIAGLAAISVPAGWSQEGADLLGEVGSRRLERTLNEGLDDSSIQARYVQGTGRFWQLIGDDPGVLIWGLGPQTDREFRGRGWGAAYDYGYVSNGWLLSVRNFGVLAMVSLILLHVRLFLTRDWSVKCVAFISAMIIAGDNYAIHQPAAFLILITVLSLANALVTARERAERGPLDRSAGLLRKRAS